MRRSDTKPTTRYRRNGPMATTVIDDGPQVQGRGHAVALASASTSSLSIARRKCRRRYFLGLLFSFGYMILILSPLVKMMLRPFSFTPYEGSTTLLAHEDLEVLPTTPTRTNNLQQDLRQNHSSHDDSGSMPSSSISSSSSLQNDENAPRERQALLKRQRQQKRKQQQRICFLAGPPKTGSSSIQTNLWRWTIPLSTYNFTDSRFPPLYEYDYEYDLDADVVPQHQHQKPVVNWIWPAPPLIIDNMKHKRKWHPGKAFHPLISALLNERSSSSNKHKNKKMVTLYNESYSSTKVIQAYRQEIQTFWDEGHDIIFGTEAMFHILPGRGKEQGKGERQGRKLIQRFSQKILPKNLKGSQMTVVMTYRTPKIDHLVSVWHQELKELYDETGGPGFYEWIMMMQAKQVNPVKQLNTLGMVDAFLDHTDWNVALIDLEGLENERWESSSFVACEILGEECSSEENTPVGLLERRRKSIMGTGGGGVTSSNSAISEPVVMNVRKHKEPPNMSRQALDEMDDVLTGADCHLLTKFLKRDSEKRRLRLKLHHPAGMKRLMKRCQVLPKKYKRNPKDELIHNLVAVAMKHGPASEVLE